MWIDPRVFTTVYRVVNRILGYQNFVIIFNHLQKYLAERQGFEPWDGLPRQLISNQSRSATPAPLQTRNRTWTALESEVSINVAVR